MNIMQHLKQEELSFFTNIIEGMKCKEVLLLLMKSSLDNTGAVHIANNQTTGLRTRHMDIRTH